MKKITLFFILINIIITGLMAQTAGDLAVSVTTSAAGGKYAPRNILAIWISSEDGKFVKTLLAFADKRNTHLNTWQTSTASAGSEFNTVDAITGATKSDHAARTCTWNGTDHTGAAVTDGKYYVQMELTDMNSTGNTASFLFTKGDTEQVINPADNPSFSAVSLNWVPSTNVSIIENHSAGDYEVFPNPSSGIYHVSGSSINGLEIRDLSGKLIEKNPDQMIDISDRSEGIYLLYIISEDKIVIKKIIKR